jgi:hypothetical protein
MLTTDPRSVSVPAAVTATLPDDSIEIWEARSEMEPAA